jgi:hypothetical protein
MVEQFQPLTLSTQQLMLNNKGSGVEDYDALKMLFETFSSDHANCKSCEFGDRFHTPFTSLKSSFRGLFRFKDHINEPHVSLDLANSQFYFLAVLMSKPILIKRYLPEFKIVLPLLKGSSEENDVHDFMKLTSAGILYEYWAEKRWPIESLTCQLTTRDRAKSELSYVLFGKVYTHPSTPNYNELKDAKELFQKLFPTVWRIIVGIKELGKEELPFMDQFYYDKRTGKYKGNKLSHKNISALLQRLESRILIGTISSRLIKKKVVFVTIHDSFLAPSKFEKLIKNEIELFFKWYKLPPPKLKLETL